MSVSESEARAAVEAVIARTGMQVSDEERERLVRLYPLVRERTEALRMVETRYAEPAIIYPAAVHN
ncbi:MAG: hypothetical protein U0893_12965 [Chloroflexota bacterium]